MRRAILLTALLSTSAWAAVPPEGRAWRCPIAQRFNCGTNGCVSAGNWGRYAIIDPNQGWIVPCRAEDPGTYECTPHAARFGPGREAGSVTGLGRAVPVYATVTADNRFTITYAYDHLVHFSTGTCEEAPAPEIVNPPVPMAVPRPQ